MLSANPVPLILPSKPAQAIVRGAARLAHDAAPVTGTAAGTRRRPHVDQARSRCIDPPETWSPRGAHAAHMSGAPAYTSMGEASRNRLSNATAARGPITPLDRLTAAFGLLPSSSIHTLTGVHRWY
jgi:hypothetical protein